MSKKGMIVARGSRGYKLLLDDLKKIIYRQKKVRPAIPSFYKISQQS